MFYFKTILMFRTEQEQHSAQLTKTLKDLKFAKPQLELQKQFQSIVGKYDK